MKLLLVGLACRNKSVGSTIGRILLSVQINNEQSKRNSAISGSGQRKVIKKVYLLDIFRFIINSDQMDLKSRTKDWVGKNIGNRLEKNRVMAEQEWLPVILGRCYCWTPKHSAMYRHILEITTYHEINNKFIQIFGISFETPRNQKEHNYMFGVIPRR